MNTITFPVPISGHNTKYSTADPKTQTPNTSISADQYG